MILFAAATGLRPGEWNALEHCDIDIENRLVHVRRAYRSGRIKHEERRPPRRPAPADRPRRPRPPTAPQRYRAAVPRTRRRLPRPCTTGARATGGPAQREAGISPIRRVYDLRHTFATFALHAGLGTFELSRYMGTSLINIDRTYGHLVKNGHHQALAILDGARVDARGRFVDVGPTANWPLSKAESAS